MNNVNNQPVPLQNIHILSEDNLSKGKIKVGINGRGRTVLSVEPQWSLVRWLKNTFGNRDAFKDLHNQFCMAAACYNEQEDTTNRVINIVKRDVLPVFSKKKNAINENTIATTIKDFVPTFNLLINDSQKAYDHAELQASYLNALFESKTIQIDNTDNFLTSLMTLKLIDPEKAKMFENIEKKLEDTFKNSKKQDLYNKKCHAIRSKAISFLKKTNLDKYNKLLDNTGEHSESYHGNGDEKNAENSNSNTSNPNLSIREHFEYIKKKISAMKEASENITEPFSKEDIEFIIDHFKKERSESPSHPFNIIKIRLSEIINNVKNNNS